MQADREAIAELLQAYARAIDGRELESLRSVFTPDARIEYAFEQGTTLEVAKMIPWLAQALRIFRHTDHQISDAKIELAGDAAHSTCRLVARHIQVERDGRERLIVESGTYTDEHVRTPAGWRIRARRLERLSVDGEYLPPKRVQLFDRPSGPPTLRREHGTT